MHTYIDKNNTQKAKQQSKTKPILVAKLNHWLAKIGKSLNTEQQSHYK